MCKMLSDKTVRLLLLNSNAITWKGSDLKRAKGKRTLEKCKRL